MSWTSGPNGGNNLFNGGAGGDLADGQAGQDTLYGADGNDTLLGGAGNDSLVGDIGAEDAPGRDSLLGDDGHDTLLGGLEADTLIAGAGNNSIHETTHVSGNDSIDLGAGDDRFLSLSQNDRDVILGGEGNDTLTLSHDQHSGGAGSTIDGGAGDNSIRAAITATQTGRNTADFSLGGGDGQDTITAFRGNDTLSGGDGNDRILTSAGRDSLAGDAGDDVFTWSGIAGSATIDGGEGSDTLDLGALFGGSAWSTATDGAGAAVYTYNPDGGAAEATLYARNVESVLCYAAGTRIATPRGEIPVEALRVGDLVTCAGPDAGVQPILWIGRIEAQLAGHPHPERAWPVLIRAHALGQGRPARDLRVSPDHGVFLEGALVPAKLLVDGVTILQERWWAAITYLHLELPEHAILLAEGLPAESWLDDGRRDEFDNAGLAAQFVDFGLELAAARPAGKFPLISDPAAAARLRDRAAPGTRAPALTWAAHRATKREEETEDTSHAPPPVRWRQRRHPHRAEA